VDAEQVKPEEVADSMLRQQLEGVLAGYRNAELWRVTSNSMIDAPLLPGDFLIVDLDGKRQLGSIVLAIQHEGGREIVLLRAHFPPKLFAVRPDPPAPLLVDGRNVTIRGVVAVRLQPEINAQSSSASRFTAGARSGS